MDATTFSGLALGNEAARRLLTFNGMTTLRGATLDALATEIREIFEADLSAARNKSRSDAPARAKQSAAQKASAKAKPPSAPAPSSRPRWSDEDWQRWNQGGYYGRTWYSASEWRQYWYR